MTPCPHCSRNGYLYGVRLMSGRRLTVETTEFGASSVPGPRIGKNTRGKTGRGRPRRHHSWLPPVYTIQCRSEHRNYSTYNMIDISIINGWPGNGRRDDWIVPALVYLYGRQDRTVEDLARNRFCSPTLPCTRHGRDHPYNLPKLDRDPRISSILFPLRKKKKRNSFCYPAVFYPLSSGRAPTFHFPPCFHPLSLPQVEASASHALSSTPSCRWGTASAKAVSGLIDTTRWVSHSM